MKVGLKLKITGAIRYLVQHLITSLKNASKWGRLLQGVTAEKGPCTQLRGVDTKEECSKKREHQVKGPTGMSLPCLDIMQSTMEEAIRKATQTTGWY